MPAWEKTSPIPTSTSIEPTEFWTRYFTPASRLCGCWVWYATSMYEATAAVSNHTHRLKRSPAQPRPIMAPTMVLSRA